MESVGRYRRFISMFISIQYYPFKKVSTQKDMSKMLRDITFVWAKT